MKIEWSIIRRSLNGSLSDEEKVRLDEWLASNEANQATYKNIQFFYSSEPEPIEESELDLDRKFSSFVQEQRSKKGRHIMWGWSVAAAVVLAIGFVIHYQTFFGSIEIQQSLIVPGSPKAQLILASGEKIDLDTAVSGLIAGVKIFNEPTTGIVSYNVDDSAEDGWNTINIPNGGEYKLQLPDGTEVWLNSETSLRFPSRFATASREVFLSGEALFKVTSNAAHPFIVHSGDRDVQVLGTTFNISSYEDDATWQATLVEGSVSVHAADHETLMKPDQHYTYYRENGSESLNTVDTQYYTAWVDGRFYFQSANLEDIVRKLQRWYNFEIAYDDYAIREMRFTGYADKHHPIEEFLEMVEMTNDVHFKVEGTKVTADRKSRK